MKTLFIVIVILLYLFTPYTLFLGIIGGALDEKYLVEPAFFAITSNKALTEGQLAEKLKEAEQLRRTVDDRSRTFVIWGVVSFCVATSLLIKRKSILRIQRSNDPSK